MSTLSTHVLDTSLGRPAAGVPVTLSRDDGTPGGVALGAGVTDADGRLRALVAGEGTLGPGTYRLRFDVGAYFAAGGRETFYPEATVVFRVGGGDEHYHVPLLLSPFGYATYRGS